MTRPPLRTYVFTATHGTTRLAFDVQAASLHHARHLIKSHHPFLLKKTHDQRTTIATSADYPRALINNAHLHDTRP